MARKNCAILIVLTLLLQIVTWNVFVDADAASRKTQLKKGKARIQLGGSYSIALKNKKKKASYTYKSSNRKVAAVNKKGKVRGVGLGTAKITVRQSWKKKTSKVGVLTVSVVGKKKEKDNPYANLPSGYDEKKDGVAYGKLTEVQYDSKTTGARRKCYVYTPPGYSADQVYPVMYLLHGIGGTHTEWLGGNPSEVLGNLASLGEAKPMVVVMPNVRAMKNDGYPSDVMSRENINAFDNFINDLRDDLMPFIQANYSVSDRREERAVAGLSMGGKESLYIGITLSSYFGYIGAFSPAPGLLSNTSLNSPGQLAPEEMTLPDEYKDSTFIMICNGNNDGVVGEVPNSYHMALERNGIRHTYYTIDGGHDMNVWKNGLYHFAKAAFK